ncbi:MAG: hypothetical protein RLY14_152 [Planctomycetota bacterium]|jgi:uncharacterized membrane protein
MKQHSTYLLLAASFMLGMVATSAFSGCDSVETSPKASVVSQPQQADGDGNQGIEEVAGEKSRV